MIREIEGFLMVEAARAEGRDAARRFTERVPWLTETQAEDVGRAYVEGYLELRRELWRDAVGRAGSLRGEYEERYRLLRGRLLTAAWFIGVGVAGVTGIVVKILGSTG
ncbi:hypothetical protein ABII15_17910 [Streptomyces sp. HUAS MG91]|uniref:Uncharacterized protein n=1 Tax=Streptomyces tabacisoli TaxID=3156398 RepID=A0AAU8IV91_9ACTN